jgi:hypothetical protein
MSEKRKQKDARRALEKDALSRFTRRGFGTAPAMQI